MGEVVYRVAQAVSKIIPIENTWKATGRISGGKRMVKRRGEKKGCTDEVV